MVHHDFDTRGDLSQPRRTGPSSAEPARPAGRGRPGPVAVHLLVLCGYLAASVVLTWPHARWLVEHRLPATLDTGSYVWGLWWLAHCVTHATLPWSTAYQAAPAGTQLGLHSLMPLVGAVFTPVTLALGPSVSFDVLSIAMPGLLCYAMYRVARLWLPGQIGPVAAGGLFGFCAILSYQAGTHISLAVGALFMPMALETAVRLQRRPGIARAVLLGAVVGASLLVDQETAVLTSLTAAGALLPWLLRPVSARPPATAVTAPAARWPKALARRWRAAAPRADSWLARPLLAALAAVTALAVASPQLVAMYRAQQADGRPEIREAIRGYLTGMRLPYMFEPSPRVTVLGLGIPHGDYAYTFGTVLTLLALTGLILARRRLSAWLLAVLWLAAAALALGSSLHIGSHTYTPAPYLVHGVKLSGMLPFSYLVRLPGMAQFREPSRLAELGLVPAALLAGYAVTWLRRHARPVLAVALTIGALELGQAPAAMATMSATMPAVDRPIQADRSASVVLDVPFGLRGGTGILGHAFPPQTEVLATADGHPLANAYLARVPAQTRIAILARPFYRDLIDVQKHQYRWSGAELAVAARSARRIGIGWVLVWTKDPAVRRYLTHTGFRYDYRAGRALVYRPAGRTVSPGHPVSPG
jgi:hypothetical protein